MIGWWGKGLTAKHDQNKNISWLPFFPHVEGHCGGLCLHTNCLILAVGCIL